MDHNNSSSFPEEMESTILRRGPGVDEDMDGTMFVWLLGDDDTIFFLGNRYRTDRRQLQQAYPWETEGSACPEGLVKASSYTNPDNQDDVPFQIFELYAPFNETIFACRNGSIVVSQTVRINYIPRQVVVVVGDNDIETTTPTPEDNPGGI
jgi:hypothetical protein